MAVASEQASDPVTLPACLAALPDGYQILKGERGVLVVRDEYSAPLVAAGFGPDSREEFPASDLAGRRALGVIDLEGEELLVRFHQHGGLLRFLTGDRFLDTGRAFQELMLADRLASLGVPTPRIIGARIQRALGPFWRMALVSARVPGALDLVHVLRDLDQASSARVLMRSMGALVGQLHRVGLHHVDLHPGNMLVEAGWASQESPKLWILDLDLCSLEERLSEELRLGMLRRLVRYAQRRPELRPSMLTRTNVVRFLLSYRAALEGSKGAAGWKQDWRSVTRSVEQRGLLHRLGWGLEDLVGAGAKSRHS